MRPRIAIRYSTRLGRWASRVGVATIVARMARKGPDIRVTKNAIYEWLSGRSAPEDPRAIALAQVSRGELTLNDIYGHRREVQRRARQRRQGSGE